MINKPKQAKVRLSDEEAEAIAREAEGRAAHFRSSGNRQTAMPWTSDQFSEDELRAWLASRKAAAQTIDAATCEIAWWHAPIMDEYGIRRVFDELDPEEDQVGRVTFVRGPHSCGWVSRYDLSDAQRAALDARVRRQDTH